MLRIKDTSVYYGYIQALKDVSIDVPKGKIVALLGANGAGKTTILKTISGVLKPASGNIEFDGEIITNSSVEEIVSKGIIHVPEGRQIFPELTVYENLIVGAYTRSDKTNIRKTVSRVYEYFPILKEREKQRAGTLSGGEQQMLAIGRGLMGNPKLLLLDEPSLGLAPLIVKEIFNIIKEINNEGTTILLVEQNAYQALSIAHHCYVLETGKVAIQGETEEVINDERIKAAYLGSSY